MQRVISEPLVNQSPHGPKDSVGTAEWKKEVRHAVQEELHKTTETLGQQLSDLHLQVAQLATLMSQSQRHSHI